MSGAAAVDPREVLARDARGFYQRGWMVGTSGNLSHRDEAGAIWITASGRSKGELGPSDFVKVNAAGAVVERGRPGDRPSAELSIHQAIYALFPKARACYHVHSVEANLAGQLTDTEVLPLPRIEMIKGLGIWDSATPADLPIFENHPRVPDIAAALTSRFEASAPHVPAMLIREHGITVWGESAEAARNYVELTEFLLRFATQSASMSAR